MRVAFEVTEFFFVKSFKCSISSNFVLFSESHGSLRNNMTVVLNSKDSVQKSVDFLKVDLNNFNNFFFAGSEGIKFSVS